MKRLARNVEGTSHTRGKDFGLLCEWWEEIRAVKLSRTVMETDFLF